LCRKLTLRPEGKGSTLWKAVADYSTEPVSEREQEQRQTPNPLDRAARIRWRSVPASTVAIRDNLDEAIRNSAGDEFDPPTDKLEAYWCADVTKNLGAVPVWLLDYMNATNAEAFVLDGLGVPAGRARLAGLEIGEWANENGVRFRPATFSIEVHPETWDLQILDAGLNVFIRGKKQRAINAGDGSPTPGPVLLDGLGGQLRDEDEPVFLRFPVYPEKDFSVLPLT
jgi:hypothetical protein